MQDISELMSKLPDGLERALQGAYKKYLVYRVFLQFLPHDARAWLAETTGRQVIKACKECDFASDEVRQAVYHIVAGLFLLEMDSWECPWDLYEPEPDPD